MTNEKNETEFLTPEIYERLLANKDAFYRGY